MSTAFTPPLDDLRFLLDELIDVDFRDHFRAAILRDSHYEDSECFKSITTFRLEKLNKPSIFDFQICVVIKFIFYIFKCYFYLQIQHCVEIYIEAFCVASCILFLVFNAIYTYQRILIMYKSA